MTRDPRHPGPLVEPHHLCLRMLPAALAAHCPSIGAARRIAERVNQVWHDAWDDELRSAPVYAEWAVLSEWFDGTQPPWEPGVYERHYGRQIRFSYWTGKWWCTQGHTPQLAENVAVFGPSKAQVLPWRGLAAPSA